MNRSSNASSVAYSCPAKAENVARLGILLFLVTVLFAVLIKVVTWWLPLAIPSAGKYGRTIIRIWVFGSFIYTCLIILAFFNIDDCWGNLRFSRTGIHRPNVAE